MDPTDPWLTIYQPLLIGLGAVVLGLMGNTGLEWLKLHWSHKRSARALRNLLIQELLAAERAADLGVNRMQEWLTSMADDTSDMNGPVYEKYPVYDLYLKDFGLLTSEETSAVMVAYSYLHAQAEYLIRMSKLDQIEGRLLATVTHDQRSTVLAMHREVLKKLTPAIDALDKHMPVADRPKRLRGPARA